MKTCLLTLLVTFIPTTLLAQGSPTREQAAAAQEKAVKFFSTQVAVDGGYVYQVTSDLKLREGEGDAGSQSVWVQPPGTPAVGQALIEAYERTGQKYLLEAAIASARCLLRGQLHSGGWQNHIDFDPELRTKLAYRVDGKPSKKARNLSSFDDDQTQAALRFLMHVDRALQFKDEPIHEAVQFGLQAVLKNQYPSGGWGQVFDDPEKLKERLSAAKTNQRAGYPESWKREYPGGDYWFYYTLNDQALVRVMQTMWLAGEIYESPAYRDSALKAADFLLAAQMPEPQPAWAQQYNYAFEPIWARKFEPPSVSGGESQVVIEALLDLTIATADKRYLAPIPKAIAYLKSSRLPDGRLARFYELKTNKPLYFTRDYKLTYSDDDMPTHYGFKVESRLERLETRHNQLAALSVDELKQLAAKQKQSSSRRGSVDAERVAKIIAQMDERGAWVEPGQLKYIKQTPKERPMIHSETFIKNLEVLSRFTAKD